MNIFYDVDKGTKGQYNHTGCMSPFVYLEGDQKVTFGDPNMSQHFLQNMSKMSLTLPITFKAFNDKCISPYNVTTCHLNSPRMIV